MALQYYEFSQSGNHLTVKMFLPQNTSQEDLEIEITNNSLRVALKNDDPLIEGSLFEEVSRTYYTIENDIQFLIHLEKQNEDIWPLVIFDHLNGKMDSNSEYLLFDYYEEREEFEKAFEFLLSSAKKSHYESTFEIAKLYFEGSVQYEIEPNHREALKWWEISAKLGNGESQLMAGNHYTFGDGCPIDYRKAEKYYNQAIKNKNREALFYLGRLYFEGGSGIQQSFEKAAELWIKASEYNHPEAIFQLGLLYMNGNGVAKDIKKAESLIKKAKEIEPSLEIPHEMLVELSETSQTPKPQKDEKPEIDLTKQEEKKDSKKDSKQEEKKDSKNVTKKKCSLKSYIIGGVVIAIIAGATYFAYEKSKGKSDDQIKKRRF
ncbi:sel1l adaptor subunit of erad e3 ubiquitin ligase [Anaeramoeba ignava]|uniref:Sel1l adaptor subunit of erad e3 ubiquitin ligase n=1 Tax=Anaeramoeba ignava TaxID=1746090 RepID=A0A9Q0LMM8_ANAIG|nr:sel1l adaptor subunit of erad e3 ubiquitin ligase [Anaeramoeba ignava]